MLCVTVYECNQKSCNPSKIIRFFSFCDRICSYHVFSLRLFYVVISTTKIRFWMLFMIFHREDHFAEKKNKLDVAFWRFWNFVTVNLTVRPRLLFLTLFTWEAPLVVLNRPWSGKDNEQSGSDSASSTLAWKMSGSKVSMGSSIDDVPLVNGNHVGLRRSNRVWDFLNSTLLCLNCPRSPPLRGLRLKVLSGSA